MKIAFVLTMPNVGSWNGKWTGEQNLYCKVVTFGTGKSAKEVVDRILAKSSYYYNFGDGWGASVSVRAVDAKEAARLRRKSKGFCGYDWMIDSIIKYGEILSTAPHRMEGQR